VSGTAKLWVKLVGAFFIVIAVAVGAIWLLSDDLTTTDAYVAGHVHPLAPRVTGTVVRILTDDNRYVRKGDVLVLLDPRDFGVQVEQARAQLAQAQAQVPAAEALIEQARAAITSAEVTVERTKLDYDRDTALLASSAVSRHDYDAAKAAYLGALAALEGARGVLASSMASRQVALAQVATAKANLENAELALAYTRIIAPVDGYVGRKNVELGARVNAGQTLLSIVSDDLWIVANYKETQLRGVAIGAPVNITVDALPHRRLEGYVESFSPASGAQFALLPPDNATGNFTKIIQRVPVKIRIRPGDLAQFRAHLMPGLSAVTEIEPLAGR
jgi:membrane fusion protein (multidrug efflux system)